MTEKRFQIIHLGNPYDFVVKDHATNKTYGTLQGDDKSLTKLLNELDEENRELQRHLDVMRSGALTDDKRIKELYDENEQLNKSRDELISENRHIKKTIQTMLINERTQIGKNVLKQLMETIQ